MKIRGLNLGIAMMGTLLLTNYAHLDMNLGFQVVIMLTSLYNWWYAFDNTQIKEDER